MMHEQTPIKIEIPVEDETTFIPEQPEEAIKPRGKRLRQWLKRMANRIWASGARKKVTKGVKRGATAVAAKGNEVVRERMVKAAEQQAREQAAAVKQRLQETDWKHETQKGTASGLRWLSHKLAQLAERFTPADESDAVE